MELDKLKDTLGKLLYDTTSDKSIKDDICIRCKKPPRFKTQAGKDEYRISGMCEYCFDELFKDCE